MALASKGWIGVDLDGTLAFYDRWRGHRHIGVPVAKMLEEVKRWIAEGIAVRIFTARVSGDRAEAAEVVDAIHEWCLSHGLPELPVTCIKDYDMITLFDDRAVHVIPNTGQFLGRCRATGVSTY